MIGKLLYRLFVLAIVAMLQIYFFDRLPLSPYVHLSFYLSYVILLSIDAPRLFVLLSSTLLGVVIDFSTGTGGLITVAVTAAAYARILLLRRMVSEDNLKQGFLPSVRAMGAGRWFFYCGTVVFINGFLIILLESGWLLFMSIALLLRFILNVVSTTLLMYIIQLIFDRKPKSSY